MDLHFKSYKISGQRNFADGFVGGLVPNEDKPKSEMNNDDKLLSASAQQLYISIIWTIEGIQGNIQCVIVQLSHFE